MAFSDEPGDIPRRSGSGKRRSRSRKRPSWITVALALLIVLQIVGLGALAWFQRDRIVALVGGSGAPPSGPVATTPPDGGSPATIGTDPANDSGVGAAGSGSDIATAPGTGSSAGPSAMLLVASQAGGAVAAASGSATWSFSSAAGSVVTADILLPERGLSLRLAISKNDDVGLPASHLVEVIVDGTDVSIAEVVRLVLKQDVGERGQPLVAGSVKVADGLFWIALSGSEDDVRINTDLLRNRDWIDLQFLYEGGQPALVRMRIDDAGRAAIDQAFAAWDGS